MAKVRRCRVELRGKPREDSGRMLLKAFNRRVGEAGILSKFKESEYYESPGQKRRKKRNKAEQERKKQLRRFFE